MSSTIIELNKPVKTPLSASQKLFNRLRKKVENLQLALQRQNQTLDASLQFYYEQIQPEKKALVNVLNEFVKFTYGYYKSTKQLSKKHKNYLKAFILNRIDVIFASSTYSEVDLEICEIFKALEGVSYQEVVLDDMNSFKDEMREMFKHQGMDIDLSKLDITDDEHDVMQKMYEAIDNARSGIEEDAPTKPKSKKQIQKELKEKELQELQHKGVGSIYKQLAKVFHPDLEQAAEKKLEKEELMKKLTNAYASNDLHTLLSLQMQWLCPSDSEDNLQNDDQLKIYNSILKDQVEALQESIENAALHPKYMPLQNYLSDIGFAGIPTLKVIHRELESERSHFASVVNKFKNGDLDQTVRAILLELDLAFSAY